MLGIVGGGGDDRGWLDKHHQLDGHEFVKTRVRMDRGLALQFMGSQVGRD